MGFHGVVKLVAGSETLLVSSSDLVKDGSHLALDRGCTRDHQKCSFETRPKT